MEETTPMVEATRVSFYIDGFNFLHAIMTLFGKKYYWINYRKLATQYLGPEDKLAKVYYFTALYFEDMVGMQNHKEFIKAQHVMGVKTIYGKFQQRKVKFNKAHNQIFSVTYGKKTDTNTTKIATLPIPDRLNFGKYEEKRTDVNMATQIVVDGLANKYDKAIIITGDSDIAPAINAVRKFDKTKEFISVVPIGRSGTTIKQACQSDSIMTEQHLMNSLLPPIVKMGEHSIYQPADWN